MKHPIEKMRECLDLLPPPGGEVVAECLDEIEKLEQQLAEATDQIAAAVAACKAKDDALNKLMMLPNKYPGHREIAATGIIMEALAVMPSISEWKTRWQKENAELCQQLATKQAERTEITLAERDPLGNWSFKKEYDQLRQQLATQSKYPPESLTWLYTHCRAIGMDCKSDSGKWEHDIALFTSNQKTQIESLHQQLTDYILCEKEPVAFRVMQINGNHCSVATYDVFATREEADAAEGLLGDYWAGTEPLYRAKEN